MFVAVQITVIRGQDDMTACEQVSSDQFVTLTLVRDTPVRSKTQAE
jgi:hypothetical protein